MVCQLPGVITWLFTSSMLHCIFHLPPHCGMLATCNCRAKHALFFRRCIHSVETAEIDLAFRTYVGLANAFLVLHHKRVSGDVLGPGCSAVDLSAYFSRDWRVRTSKVAAQWAVTQADWSHSDMLYGVVVCIALYQSGWSPPLLGGNIVTSCVHCAHCSVLKVRTLSGS